MSSQDLESVSMGHEKLNKIANYLRPMISYLDMDPVFALNFLCSTRSSPGQSKVSNFNRPVEIFKLYQRMLNDIKHDYVPTRHEALNMMDANGEPVETYMFLYSAHQIMKTRHFHFVLPPLVRRRELVLTPR